MRSTRLREVGVRVEAGVEERHAHAAAAELRRGPQALGRRQDGRTCRPLHGAAPAAVPRITARTDSLDMWNLAGTGPNGHDGWRSVYTSGSDPYSWRTPRPHGVTHRRTGYSDRERSMARNQEVIRQWSILRTLDSQRTGVHIKDLARTLGVDGPHDPARHRRAAGGRLPAVRRDTRDRRTYWKITRSWCSGFGPRPVAARS